MEDEICGLDLLIGKTLTSITVNYAFDEITFVCSDGQAFRAYHMQDCCEEVGIYDVEGEVSELIDSPIIEAETTVDSENWPNDVSYSINSLDSFTWTTHFLKAENGKTLMVRWLGVSNGYYSERVHFQRTHIPLN